MGYQPPALGSPQLFCLCMWLSLSISCVRPCPDLWAQSRPQPTADPTCVPAWLLRRRAGSLGCSKAQLAGPKLIKEGSAGSSALPDLLSAPRLSDESGGASRDVPGSRVLRSQAALLAALPAPSWHTAGSVAPVAHQWLPSRPSTFDSLSPAHPAAENSFSVLHKLQLILLDTGSRQVCLQDIFYASTLG